MKLDINCVRDILLTIESINYPVHMSRKEFCSKINSYSEYEIEYCCLKLYEGNYIMLYIPEGYPTYEARIKIDCIGDLTFQGHELLEKIRTPENFQMIKKIGGQIGDFSLTAAKEIGMTLLQSALSSIFPLS